MLLSWRPLTRKLPPISSLLLEIRSILMGSMISLLLLLLLWQWEAKQYTSVIQIKGSRVVDNFLHSENNYVLLNTERHWAQAIPTAGVAQSFRGVTQSFLGMLSYSVEGVSYSVE